MAGPNYAKLNSKIRTFAELKSLESSADIPPRKPQFIAFLLHLFEILRTVQRTKHNL
jgi:hypothetical protein